MVSSVLDRSDQNGPWRNSSNGSEQNPADTTGKLGAGPRFLDRVFRRLPASWVAGPTGVDSCLSDCKSRPSGKTAHQPVLPVRTPGGLAAAIGAGGIHRTRALRAEGAFAAKKKACDMCGNRPRQPSHPFFLPSAIRSQLPMSRRGKRRKRPFFPGRPELGCSQLHTSNL